jgi:DNA transposition AAA+ family ATPase
VKYLGIPIKDRTPENIRDALKELDPEIFASFARLHGHAVEKQLGLSALHNRTGISTAALSKCYNGTYADDGGDVAEIAERIEQYFYRMEQAERYGGIRTFVKTDLSQYLFNTFEKARITRRLTLIESPEQMGKTTAAKRYVEDNDHGRTAYFQMPGGSTSLAGVIHDLADALGIAEGWKSLEKKLRIRHKLSACDLVIIDEWHVVYTWPDREQARMLDFLRTELLNNGARGVVLVATNADILDNLERFRGRTRYNTGQLIGRMRNQVIRLDGAEDVRETDVAAIVSRYYKPGKRIVSSLTRMAQQDGFGHFGLLVDILNESWSVAKAHKTELSDAIVEAEAKKTWETLRARKELFA